MFNKVLNKIKEIFSSSPRANAEDLHSPKEEAREISAGEVFTNSIIEIYSRSAAYYGQQDLVFFEQINAYGAFKYPVVKDILTSGEHIGVSTVHLALNSIYFSEDEKKHQYHKKTAIKHMPFLAKKLQFADNEYTHRVFEILLSHCPKNESFNLVDNLLNPIVFINALKEFGFLETFPQFDPESEQFSFAEATDQIRQIFSDTDKLELLLKNHLDQGGKLPSEMQAFLDDIDVEKDVNPDALPQFFRSIINTAVESTAGFLGAYIYTVFTQYPELIAAPDHQKLYWIANEVLRIHTPVPFIFRTVSQDTEYAEISLKKGDMIILFLGAANMDPTYFENPYEAKEGRKEKHLTFGRGQLACIGEFAGFRITMNVLKYLSARHDQLEFGKEQAAFIIHNSMQKILDIQVVFHD